MAAEMDFCLRFYVGYTILKRENHETKSRMIKTRITEETLHDYRSH